MLKVLELFSGTGCQVQALKNIGIECVSTQCEIDKYAVNTYNQLHGETPNLGDISKVNPDNLQQGQWDLITYSFPCQSISIAGKQAGLAKNSGTTSSLLWECEKIIRKVKPKYLLMENVANLLSDKFKPFFYSWLKTLEEMGYCNYYDVLNAKDFGIPQNRSRIFCVSILGKHVPYVFPQKQPLKLRLKDMLEDRPDERYYLKKEIVDKFKFNNNGTENKLDTDIDVVGKLDVKGFECCKRVYDTQGNCPSITAGGGDHVHKIIDEPMICASRGRYNEQGITEQQLEINKENTTNTITTVSKDNLVIEPINTEPDGTSRTIKAQYAKTSAANFIRNGTFGATGVKEEPKIERIGGMYDQATRWGVYSDEGISPTITASMGLGGGHVPMVEEKQERLSKQAYETLEENKCKDGDVINPFNKKVVDDGICPTITTRPEGFKTANLIVVDEKIKPSVAKNFEREKENIANSNKDIYQAQCKSGFQDNQIGLKVSPTIRANNNVTHPLDNHFRIRKLTPRETWRLMGWKDEQFDKIKGISNAQLYKMAGNGIVINVLEAIFTNMFLRKPTKEEEKFVVDKPMVQLELL